MSSSVQSIANYGASGLIVDVECNVSNNLPTIVIVGFANKAVDEARERVRGAFVSCDIQLPRKRITINLAPAEIPKDSSSFDLAIAAAIMQAMPGASRPFEAHEALLGELGLDGSVRPVRGLIGKIRAGVGKGIRRFFIPAANLNQAQLIPDITVIPLKNLHQLASFVFGGKSLDEVNTNSLLEQPETVVATAHAGNVNKKELELRDALKHLSVIIDDIRGQAAGKRALEITAAGGHNLLLSGPPGTGKSMLARALPSVLPVMSREEMLEVTHLHSLASKDYDKLVEERPFRSPHHSASHVAMVGGGMPLRPGEISLAHHGVLLLDEFPEFARSTVEALRQPLEDRSIAIARARDTWEFPADFILVATANPCPCGYYGSTSGQRRCDCSPATIRRYQSKLSGPILDRIDVYSDVHAVDHVELLQAPSGSSETAAMRQRIITARQRQSARYGSSQLNAAMSNLQLHELAGLEQAASELLSKAGQALSLSARALLRTVKVARTIADLADSDTINQGHVSEALQYRSRPIA